MEWQVVAGLHESKLIVERIGDQPFPLVEVQESLPGGRLIKAVWSWLRGAGVSKLVTVHFFDAD
jgi:hypothetical protein